MGAIKTIMKNNIAINNLQTKIDYVAIAKQIVLAHLPNSNYTVFLFGSRAVGNHKINSDIDIGILGNQKFPLKNKILIEEALEESIVPYKVDLVDFFNVDEIFKQYALQKTIPWA